ncbi:MAG: hypothetical protein ABIF18_01260 [archaeon]
MAKMKNGTICMVVNSCIINEFGNKREIKGHLIYGDDTFCGRPHIMHLDSEGFTVVRCKSQDIVSIDQDDLNNSLSSAYRKSRFMGNVNPFLRVPLSDLKQEYSRYKAHFNEYLS